jgi:hypothetical protein
VLVTCRSDEAPLDAQVAGWLAEVRGATGVEEIPLGPLSRAEVAAQAAALAGGPVPPGVAVSFTATLVIYELAIRRCRVTRLLFGMQPASSRGVNGHLRKVPPEGQQSSRPGVEAGLPLEFPHRGGIRR